MDRCFRGPQPCHTPGVSKLSLWGLAPAKNQASLPSCVIGRPAPFPTPVAPPGLLASLLCYPFLLTQNCKCLVVTMTYCLGQCSFPMHTNILWLLYMNIFNDMEKVVDFLFLRFFLLLLVVMDPDGACNVGPT